MEKVAEGKNMCMHAYMCLYMPKIPWKDTKKLAHPVAGDGEDTGWAGGSDRILDV